MIYTVRYDYHLKRIITCTVEAESEAQALELATDPSNHIDDDEEFAPEEGDSSDNFRIVQDADNYEEDPVLTDEEL